MKKILLTLFFLTVVSSSYGITTGNDFYSHCENPANPYNFYKGICLGIVEGLISGHYYLRKSVLEKHGLNGFYCMPIDLQTGQAVSIVYKYIHNNPSKRHNSAGLLVVLAFKEAFPCSTK